MCTTIGWHDKHGSLLIESTADSSKQNMKNIVLFAADKQGTNQLRQTLMPKSLHPSRNALCVSYSDCWALKYVTP